ncbi:hypothetical protein [Pontibacter beigongshangensis]|uniref:hypothetical protein n=1 Tax=Pontibacter beigongshangensis TaxID=2574733 RepID=UPI00165038BE|nr:hypothetical protein [Pontibacter beigongshangensis]
MHTILKLISYLGLLLTVVPSVLVFLGKIELDFHKNLMLAGMIMWFLSAPFWLNTQNEQEAES